MAFQHYLQGTRNYLHHRATGAQTKPASVQTGLLGPGADFCECPSSCSPLLNFQEPTTIPSRPTKVKRTATRRAPHRTRASALAKAESREADRAHAHPRDSKGSTSASTRVESKWQCFGRDSLAPGSLGDLSEHTGKPCLGAQVDTPTHRCDSHVRRRPALVSAPPHVPVRPFVWGCGS